MVQGVDSFDVFVVDVVASTRQRVTLTHTNHRNAFPTWSTNQSWLTFVSDRSGRNQWDLYGLPVTGGVVNTAQASLKRLLNTGGVLLVGTMGGVDFRKPLMAWSPTAPKLAIVASDGVLYLVSTTPAGATQVDAGVLHPTELEWSPDGSLLAITTGDKVQTVAADGTSTVRVIREGDTFADLLWSPDGTWLVYRATRGSSAWFEAYDLDQSTVAAPIAITASEPDASALQSLGGYRAVMSLRPAWSSTDVLFYPSFATGALTVGIVSVDVSGLTP
jgi:Tol biopolymer transport system component